LCITLVIYQEFFLHCFIKFISHSDRICCALKYSFLRDMTSASLGICSPSFGYRIVVSASRVEILDISTLEDVTNTLSQNIWNQMPSDTAAYPRITDTSSTPLQSPTTSRSLYFVLCNLHKEWY